MTCRAAAPNIRGMDIEALPRRLPTLSALRLRRLRSRLGIVEVAVASGVPLSVLSRAERQERELPPDALERVLEVLRVAEEADRG